MPQEHLLETLLDIVCSFGFRLFGAILALFVGLKFIKWLRKRIPSFPMMARLDMGVRTFISSAAATALYVMLAVSIAMILGVPTASFIAALASCLAAIGLAMQGSLSNFAGGLMLLIFKPFRTEDYISIPDLNVDGRVMQITVVYTILHTFDGIEVTIPNGTLMNSVVKNMTITDARRVDLPFRVDPRHPANEVQEILLEVASTHPLVRTDPAPFAPITEVHGDALTYTLRVWCPNGDYWPVRFELIQSVCAAFEAHDIIVPRSQLEVHMDANTSRENGGAPC